MNTFQSNTFPNNPSYIAHFMPQPYNLAPSLTLSPQSVPLTLSHHYHPAHQQANYHTHHQQATQQHPPSSTVSNRPTPNLSRRFSSNTQNGNHVPPNSTLPQRRSYYVNSSSSTGSNSSNSSSNSNNGNNYKQVMNNVGGGTNGNHVMSNGDPKAATDSASTC